MASEPHPIEVTDAQLARLLIAAEPSKARQSHGFVFQSGASRLLGLYVPANYTDEVDAYSIKQPDDDVMRHSFKNMKAGSGVELGDLVRNAEVKRDFVMYVSFWEEFATNIRRIHVLYIEADYWRGLFPADLQPFISATAFAGITNAKSDDAKWKERRENLQEQWRAARPQGSLMSVNYKRDHKKQMRVQCAIPAQWFSEVFRSLFDEARTTQLEAALNDQPVPSV